MSLLLGFVPKVFVVRLNGVLQIWVKRFVVFCFVTINNLEFLGFILKKFLLSLSHLSCK